MLAQGVLAESPRGERKNKKQIADLRDGRIGNQQFQPCLTQRKHAPEQDCSGAERGEQLSRSKGQKAWHGVEPKPDDQDK